MKVRVNYRLYLKIFYDRIDLEIPDEYDHIDLIEQYCKFKIQKEVKQRVDCLYLDKRDRDKLGI